MGGLSVHLSLHISHMSSATVNTRIKALNIPVQAELLLKLSFIINHQFFKTNYTVLAQFDQQGRIQDQCQSRTVVQGRLFKLKDKEL